MKADQNSHKAIPKIRAWAVEHAQSSKEVCVDWTESRQQPRLD